ncbi:DUF881 domain-containing protein [Alicyclobacillus dauci]|uniref:DUF881 domain-containing protein n=1 Tax=Alicyclobacillus dauci TaxID=1475485 RepID=A0ABY6YYE8_9BACL|nr:DUF881 domain-containing protein [Alicyclobacillus dauci]WAH35530.1 DUF881 domain-containing protein [Alicyclobacillus dauci]
MKTTTKLTLSLTVVSVVLGFMVSLGYRQTELSARLGSADAGGSAVNRQLNTRLTDLKKSNQDAEQQLAKVTADLSTYEQKSTGSSQALKQLQTRLQDERILAGITPVHGPGISVTMMDGGASGTDIEQILTHDWNVRSVVNELFTAGAEAVSINNYRVVATSAVECQGPVVSVNSHRLGAPFEIDAIGDPNTLKSALQIQGGILDQLRQQGLKVSTPQVKSDIQMPAYTDPLESSTGN